uniref:NAD(P)-binding protein n=1 Tax=Steinernema glaseri TaxID=37863 RepID=A0A1I8AEK4_9BILA
MPANVVITGSNRGIGLALVSHFLKNEKVKHVFACCRNPAEAEQLNALAASYGTAPRLHLIQMDVTDSASIAKSAQEVSAVVGSEGVNLLINNAGVNEAHTKDGPQSFFGATHEVYLKIFNVNTIGPVIVTKEFLPLLESASNKWPHSGQLSIDRAAIVNISSGLGSIANNNTGSSLFPNVAYRCSKTALNQFTKTAAVDLADRNILVVSCCPGWVRTDMGGPSAPIDASQSARLLCTNFARLDASSNGGFFKLNGERDEY